MLLNPALDVPAEAGAELLADADILVPVPLTRRRLLSRRFNQSALLAQEVAHIAHIEVESLALLRVRSTKAQVGLSRQQRRENVANAFASRRPAKMPSPAGKSSSSTTSSLPAPRPRPVRAP
jgi:predicted amidophosphoribosyltransferase